MKTKSDYEADLNELYSSTYTESQAIDNLVYLTNPSRGKHVSINKLRKCYYAKTLGTLLRRLDPIAFNVGFNDFK